MTRDTMRNNMYIDDVIFSAQSLIKAEIIAQEAIDCLIVVVLNWCNGVRIDRHFLFWQIWIS